MKKNLGMIEQEVVDYAKNLETFYNFKENDELDIKTKKCIDVLMDRIRSNYQDIYNNVSLIEEPNVSHLEELEHSIKSSGRIKEKVYGRYNNGEHSIDDIVRSMEDGIRFTCIIEDDDIYIQKVTEYLNKLEGLGYAIVDIFNLWGNDYYQGINVILKNNSLRFEVQFHTTMGYLIKNNKTRYPYVVIRNPNASDIMIKKANLVRNYYQLFIPMPKGAHDFHYESICKNVPILIKRML